jgi:hypothetical protein
MSGSPKSAWSAGLRRSAFGVALAAIVFAAAACSGSSSTAGSTAKPGGGTTAHGQPSSGASAVSGAALPFGDTCGALAAADFTSLGLGLTVADHGLSNTPDTCFYQVKAADGTTASPAVTFFTEPNAFEASRNIYNKSTYGYKTVDGVGDQAFTYLTLSQVIVVQAKGHVFSIDGIGLGGTVGSGDPLADITALAKAVVGRL